MIEVLLQNGQTMLTSPVLPEGKNNLLIDIDGTITDDVPNERTDLMSVVQPYEGAVEKINEYYSAGHIITFFTSRTDEHRVVTLEWLNRHGFKFHQLLMNKPRGGNYYWVDNHLVKGIRYSNWNQLKFGDLFKSS